jgi:hypothetical protein
MKKVIYCFVALSFLLSGCGDNLSKGDAAEMIKTYIEKDPRLPMYEDFIWQSPALRGWTGFYTQFGGALSSAKIDQLRNEGYLLTDNYQRILSFTEKAKLLGVEKERWGAKTFFLQIATIDKVVVTNIVCVTRVIDSYERTARDCEAQYEIKFKPNALAELLQLGSANELTQTQTGTANFLKEKDKEWTTSGVHGNFFTLSGKI